MNNGNIYGFIDVTVLGGVLIRPLEGALVTVISVGASGSEASAATYTDRSGSTGPIRLEALTENYSEPGSSEKPVKRYTLDVTAKGYYNAEQQNIPVFPGIVSKIYVTMIPVPESDGRSKADIENTVINEGSSGNFPGGANNDI